MSWMRNLLSSVFLSCTSTELEPCLWWSSWFQVVALTGWKGTPWMQILPSWQHADGILLWNLGPVAGQRQGKGIKVPNVFCCCSFIYLHLLSGLLTVIDLLIISLWLQLTALDLRCDWVNYLFLKTKNLHLETYSTPF